MKKNKQPGSVLRRREACYAAGKRSSNENHFDVIVKLLDAPFNLYLLPKCEFNCRTLNVEHLKHNLLSANYSMPNAEGIRHSFNFQQITPYFFYRKSRG